VDWHTRSFHFETPKEEASNAKLCLFGENQDHHSGALEDDPRSYQCM
jgi:hypothetical protein